MGHYLSEKDRSKFRNRVYSLKKKLRSLSFAYFEVGDFEAIFRILGLHHLGLEPSEEDVERFEKRIEEIEKSRA